MTISESCSVLLEDLDELLSSLWKLADRHRRIPIIGRTYGVHAKVTSFGLKVLSWYAELSRGIERLKRACEEAKVGKISGAVGNYANVPPKVEEIALSRLNLRPTPVSTQVVPRDYHANFVFTVALVGAALERMATEIRHLQRTEVLEVEEPFLGGQKGSSAMPHKRNPIVSERLTGLSRILRSFVIPALEHIPLWHERDISHSSVERFILPDSTSTLHYMLVKAKWIVDNLRVNKKRMRENIR